ncbi:MAG TPA: response regulator [Pyrinomonadaceae bacterium]|nr:response regulator [Pyrinomonadaceae bacterium]
MTDATEKIRALIVDDEPIAREGVRVQLARDARVEIVAECGNGLEAVEAIRELSPDLVFLDVQMPGMDGFEVVAAVGAEAMPAVVFVTAYDKYALRAFDVSAVDYLLKPFDAERFQKAFQRAKDQLQKRDVDSVNRTLRRLLENIQPARKYLERFVVKSAGRIFFLQASEIDWIEASDNYVSLHAGRESHLIRETLTALESKLNPADFIRIRHSAIVNVKRIKELQPLFKGEYQILLHNGAKLTTSRRYRGRIADLLGE